MIKFILLFITINLFGGEKQIPFHKLQVIDKRFMKIVCLNNVAYFYNSYTSYFMTPVINHRTLKPYVCRHNNVIVNKKVK